MSINLDLSPNSSSTNFSLKNISKENQIYANNKNEFLRNNITLSLGNNNISQTFNIKDLKENRQYNKVNDSILENESNKDYGSSSGNKNRLLYEKIKKKINFNKDNSSNLFNNFINMKITKSNSNKNLNNKSKLNSPSNTNNITNKNLNIYNNSNSVEKRKKDKNQAKTSNYYDKYIINNNKNKSIKNKNQNNYDDISKNKQENNQNFNINKYIIYENTYQNIYKSKKERIKANNNQINNCLNFNKNCMSDRLRENSIKNKIGFTKINNSSLDNIMISYSQIQEKKEKILNIFSKNKKMKSKEKAFYILSISPILKLSEQIIFSRASENIRKVISIDNIVNNNKIFLTMKAKELINEITLCEKKINKSFTASKTADITLNFITTIDEQEFKEFYNLEPNKELVNIYY